MTQLSGRNATEVRIITNDALCVLSRNGDKVKVMIDYFFNYNKRRDFVVLKYHNIILIKVPGRSVFVVWKRLENSV